MIYHLLLAVQSVVPMELPRLPDYTSSFRMTCAGRDFSVTVANRGFRSAVVSALQEGRNIGFRNIDGDLDALVAVSHSVSVRPVACGPDGTIAVAVRRLDMDKSSPFLR